MADKLEAAGLEGDFDLGGTVLGGLQLTEVSLSGTGAVSKLNVDHASVRYDPLGLVRGKGIAAVGPIEIRGVEAEFVRQPDAPRKSVRETLRSLGAT